MFIDMKKPVILPLEEPPLQDHSPDVALMSGGPCCLEILTKDAVGVEIVGSSYEYLQHTHTLYTRTHIFNSGCESFFFFSLFTIWQR